MVSVILMTILSVLIILLGFGCPPILILAGPVVLGTVIMWLVTFGII